jgi:hypothetical protein
MARRRYTVMADKLRQKRNRPPSDQPWVWLTRELLESDAWSTAPINTRRLVERLMLEHMAHAGTENGRLVRTYRDFEKFGIRHQSVGAAIADAADRGLILVTHRGRASAGQDRWPSRYALGWLPTHDGASAPNRWKSWCPPAPYTGNIESRAGSGPRRNGGKLSPLGPEAAPLRGQVAALGKSAKPPFPRAGAGHREKIVPGQLMQPSETKQ